MPIQILAPQVVSKIAAGEVVERPSSVVKELIENSLDAGSTQITVETQSGGIGLIRVIDNGIGIPADEVEIAFLRHATSKIRDIDDLEKIATLGFRGEALPSIATVADVEILTLTNDSSAALYLRLENGEVRDREKRSRQKGTTISVHHLFRHIPARLKFLKSQTTENSHIANLLTQYALAYPEVRFSLVVESRQAIQTSGSGNLKEAIAEIYGFDIANQMIEINKTDQNCTVPGYVSPPSLSRSNRNYLSFFVNRRWVHSSLLSHAAEDAYHGLLMTGKHPVVIANIALPPQEIDVNVHPSKIEVKFRNSQIIYGTLSKAIKEVISRTAPPEIKNTVAFTSPPRLWADRTEAAITAATPSPANTTERAIPKPAAPSVPILRVVGQMAASYILAEGPEGLYLIDQHAAHERILFEKVLAQRSQQKLEIQGMLQPLSIELNPKQVEVINTQSGLMEQFGITLEHFGDRTYLLRAVPAVMANGNITEAVTELLDNLAGEEETDKREQKMAQSIACHGAVKAGQVLTNEEMRELIKQLEESSQPRTCPHGRPTMIHLSSRQLEKEFGRVR